MSDLQFKDLVEPVAIDKKTALRVTVLGGGSFGTAMANTAVRNGCDTMIWIRDEAIAKEINATHVNKRYLPDFKLEDGLRAVSNLEQAVCDRDIILVAIPSHSFRDVLRQIKPFISAQAVVSLTKGVEAKTFSFMSDIIREELPEVPYGVLSGPNLAKEIVAGQPAGTVIASDSELVRYAVQQALHSALFRVFGSDDVHGVELGGALKNIYAVAMGMAAAYKVGENTKSMILTRALAEMSRFAVKLGANPLTFLGLSGVGDLFATCNSPLSRNYQVGFALGSGKTLDQATKELGQTAEGINTIVQVNTRAKELDVYMPITQALYEVIFEGAPPLNIAVSLMKNGHRSDVEFVLPHHEV
ncbi:NAD(P)H-dependent glycerol-3-phosphate dehydrogenase [Acinetobacter wuhouensis]|uniref:Glycerol-3-phosphate dehydrogenase [NAD(P)+] n=1 Tax=Acinetobacter wuhouensis TaxID=1879050 RepID=A0A385C370_9GAMM|nr:MULTISPECIES: NAD(P)H-dependent glycerol-3-phosphate dehydrogenase [Acinetobacter]AXQ22119.1 NAD(P)H-dependent glycerol-3-phosphate dehydrogenase [Acinetobacter wuhouensis]AYO54665.1 NAD(P)H-dependent glycerol-3-phosphate dehydrogenase [Acinetobacter wuhouensis]RZG87609.1 NAD(P)H-dependent glycerol-3-phosphate dehydrogenase [Acinetobacter sp. WCHAc060033]